MRHSTEAMAPATAPVTRLALALVMLTLFVTACGADPTEPARSDGLVTATIVGPGPVSAAIVELRGVSELTLNGGDAFSRTAGDVIRVVLVLHEPGALRFTMTPASPEATPAALLLDVADGDRDVPESMGAYRVVIGS